jgi:hypothetical protein
MVLETFNREAPRALCCVVVAYMLTGTNGTDRKMGLGYVDCRETSVAQGKASFWNTKDLRSYIFRLVATFSDLTEECATDTGEGGSLHAE